MGLSWTIKKLTTAKYKYVPVIKDKTVTVGSLNNYRLIEKILLGHLNQFICTTDNQLGFKVKLGTDFCIYGLKEAAKLICVNWVY